MPVISNLHLPELLMICFCFLGHAFVLLLLEPAQTYQVQADTSLRQA